MVREWCKSPRDLPGPGWWTTGRRSSRAFGSGWWLLYLSETIATDLLCCQDLGSKLVVSKVALLVQLLSFPYEKNPDLRLTPTSTSSAPYQWASPGDPYPVRPAVTAPISPPPSLKTGQSRESGAGGRRSSGQSLSPSGASVADAYFPPRSLTSQSR